MSRSRISGIELIQIDTSKPGASEMIDIIGRYNSSSLIKSKSNKGKIRLAIKHRLIATPKGVSAKKLKDFSLGNNNQRLNNIIPRHSCAVTIK